ncbi:MAG: DUF4150 domain-containing protein [Candidatus Thiodiazotropha sp.]|jgi:uncharacterized Zn-binding protein involved in type VI secretion
MAKDTATIATKSDEFIIVSIAPDVCLTPVGSVVVPIPYQITHKMGQSRNVSPNVFSNGKPVFLHDESYVDNVKGDEPGVKGGIVSGVNKKISHSIEHSPTVYANGKPIVRTGDSVWMNWKK